MKSDVLKQEDISTLEKVLIKNGKIVPVPYKTLSKFSQNQLSLFCLKWGVYQLPTVELIEFLREEIGMKFAIEIGSGNGCIGRALQIKMTDNKMQNWPEIREHYAAMGQPTVQYGDDVKEVAAIPAVRTYHPKVVIGCWITHLWKPGMKEGNGNGVDEILMFGHGVDKYIHVGNTEVHKHKPLLHNENFIIETVQEPWLLSRSLDTKNNIIHIIKKH